MPLNPFLNQNHGLKVIQGKKHPESVPVLIPYIGAPARRESSGGLSGTNGLWRVFTTRPPGIITTVRKFCLSWALFGERISLPVCTNAFTPQWTVDDGPTSVLLPQCVWSLGWGSCYHTEGFIYGLFLWFHHESYQGCIWNYCAILLNWEWLCPTVCQGGVSSYCQKLLRNWDSEFFPVSVFLNQW